MKRYYIPGSQHKISRIAMKCTRPRNFTKIKMIMALKSIPNRTNSNTQGTTTTFTPDTNSCIIRIDNHTSFCTKNNKFHLFDYVYNFTNWKVNGVDGMRSHSRDWGGPMVYKRWQWTTAFFYQSQNIVCTYVTLHMQYNHPKTGYNLLTNPMTRSLLGKQLTEIWQYSARIRAVISTRFLWVRPSIHH